MADATSTETPKTRSARKLTGVVISDSMDKTRVVMTQRLVQHPLYKKYIRRNKKLYVHDEQNDSHVGDTVEVAEVTRPLSKLKRYLLRRVFVRAK